MNRKIQINNIEYIYENEVRDKEAIRKSFDLLSNKTFGLSFEYWKSLGFWKDKYIPNVLLCDGKVVSNISVSIIDMEWEGQSKRYIQLGTVMTDKDYVKKGLSKFLLNTVLEEWHHKCDAIFLFANDSVLDFYPRFGFKMASEYEYILPCCKQKAAARNLDMQDANDVELLLKKYHEGNSFSKFPMLENEGLLMFYCMQFLKNNIYYCEDINVVMIAEFNDETMICYDIYGNTDLPVSDILRKAALPDTKEIIFGFTPFDTEGMKVSLRKEEDTTLFLLDGKECLFDNQKLMFPLLSHA